MRTRILTAALICVLIIGLLPQTALAGTSDASVYRYGTVDVLSTASEKTMTDSFYYRDDWFLADPMKRNDALALSSMQLAAAATDDSVDGVGAAFLKDLGFEEFGFSGFGSADPGDCAYTWGRKTINDNGIPCTLVAVAIQSYSLDKDVKRKGWTQNFIVNGQDAAGEHEAFRQAAEKALPGVADLGASRGAGANVKFWITGHSRGGAIANLIAAKLPGYLDTRGVSAQGIYAYTFEAPAAAPAEAADALASYNYIHNYLCGDDIVSMVPPWDMGRFGVTYELKTAKTDARLEAELEKLGSSLAGEDVISDGKTQREIIDTMVNTIPTRGDYSRTQTDFPGSTYTYQEAYCALIGVIFGEGIGGLSMDAAVKNKDKLLVIAEAMARGAGASAEGRTQDAEKAYLQAAEGFKSTAKDIGITLDLTEPEIYALMKIMGPMVIDYNYSPAPDEDPLVSLIYYVTPGLTLYDQKDSLIASHHFDTVIARLKTLAPEPCDRAVSGLTSEKDPKKSAVLPLRLKSTKQEKNSVALKWNGMKGAASYAVYGAQCGKKKELTRLARTTDTAFAAEKAGEKLKSGQYYRFVVVALDGEGRVLSVSKVIHVATAGSGKASNPKAVKVRVKRGKTYKVKKKASLKRGGSIRIKGVIVKPSKDAAVKKHVGIRYASTDPAVASVSAKGIVKGKAKGTCRIVAYAQNGTAGSLRITVR